MDIKQQLLSSYLWTLVSKWFVRSIGIISTLILVRILTPEDFGIAAQSIMVIMLFKSLSAAGTYQYIIKLESVSYEQLMSSWSLGICIRVFFLALIVLTAPQIASLLNEQKLSLVLQVACIPPLLNCLQSPQLIMWRKNLEFKRLSLLDIYGKIASFATTVPLAFILQSYWALIWGGVASALVTLLLSYKNNSIRPKFDLSRAKEQLSFTKGVFVTSLLGYLRSKADIFIVSHKFGSGDVGMYSISQEFSQLPLTQVILPMASPLFSGIAKSPINGQQDKVYKYLSVVYLIILPSVVGISLLSDEIVATLLGKGWEHASPILSNLSWLMIVFATTAAFKQIFILRGMFKGPIIVDFVGLALIFMALFSDSVSSVENFSIYRIMVGACVLFLSIFTVKLILNFSIISYFKTLILPSFCSLIMYLCITQYFDSLLSGFDGVLYILLTAGLGFIAYIICLLALLKLFHSKVEIWGFNYSLLIYTTDILKKKVLAKITKNGS